MSDLVTKISDEVNTNYKRYQFIVVGSQIIVGLIVLFFVARAVLRKEPQK